jgi:microcystin-dependent protein
MEPFIGQLMLASFSFPPRNWLQCDGQDLSIGSFPALFRLLGTAFGGDGARTFFLPNLQGRAPIGMGNGYNMGNAGGEAVHILTSNEVPSHTHSLLAAASGGNSGSAQGALLAGNGPSIFVAPGNPVNMIAAGLPGYGGGQAHENRTPFLVMNWCISMTGIFPTPA